MENKDISVRNVRTTKLDEPMGSLVGFASVNLGGNFVVNGIRVLEKKDGDIYIKMPTTKGKDEKYHDDCLPITAECHAALRDAIAESFGTNIVAKSVGNEIEDEMPPFDGQAPDKMDLKVTAYPHVNESGEGNFVGYAKLEINDSFVVNGLRAYKGKEGIFVKMPSEHGKEGKQWDKIYPLNKEIAAQLKEVTREAFAQAAEKSAEAPEKESVMSKLAAEAPRKEAEARPEPAKAASRSEDAR